ncbi:unnamed protein product, partial [Porites lobata]
KPSLKLLGVTFQSDPCNWDLHLDNILSKASSCLYMSCVCKFYGLPRIDRLFKRAFKLGYCKELFFFIENIIALKDKKLWDKITDSNSTTALDDLLPPEQTMVMLRKRCHNYILPPVSTKHFKTTFVNRCLF